ncbi:MalY, bifunctional PLP-dependent enzyme [Streptococcus pneumoniae]|nr:MalY, bifunctional PLP-dependent enzyme [Streptococcus pneumoniae]
MGKYDFTSLPNRLGHHTYKWKETETDSEVLPAWIADMDFVVLPEIHQAVQTYADQLVYGYTYASEDLIKEVQKWEATQYGYNFDKEALVFIEGVVPAISTAIQTFTKEGEAVLINTPVYPPFARSVKLNNRRLITNSFKVADETRIPHILNSLKVFSFAESLGGVESLITYPTTQTHADIPAEVRHSYGLTDDLLRLSIGIEDARDLIADLRQALEG